jgi:hypothetical protein
MAAVLVWIMIPFFAAAHAAVFKCSAEGGGIVYQDVECQPGKELRNFDTDPPNVSIVPGLPESRPAPPPKAAPAPRAAAERRTAKEKPTDTKAAGRRFAQIGMSEAEVVERFGRPEVDSRSRRGQGKQWSYLPGPGDPETITTLTIVGGKVTDVERKIVR